MLRKLFGEPEALIQAQLSLAEQQQRMGTLQAQSEMKSQKLGVELERIREERLQWMAKESTTRKELQDCKERAQDLLEQVVELTHRQRETKRSLLDQQFKTTATPLERNRFEMELTEARSRAKRAEERAKQAEEKAARLKKEEKQAARVKELESQLAWLKKSPTIHLKALGAALEKVKELEEQLARSTPTLPKIGNRRPYQKPQILRSERAGREG